MLSSSLLLTIILLVASAVSFIVISDDKGLAAGVSLGLATVMGILVAVFYYATPAMVQSIPNTIFLILLALITYNGLTLFMLHEMFDVEMSTNFTALTIVGLLALGTVVILVADFERTSFYESAEKQMKVLDEKEDVDLLTFNDSVDKIAMSKTYARYLIGKAMNQVPNGELFEINNLTIQVIDGKIHYVADLKYTSFFKWNEFKEYPGYFKLDASSTKSTVEFVPETYSYSSSAYFGKNAERAIRSDNKEKFFVGEPTIEIDDKGKVFYTMTLANPINMQVGLELYGVYLLDAKTGEGKVYKKDELPEWIDGGISPAYSFAVAEYYATWNQGRFNFSGKGQKALNDNGSFDNMKPILIDGQLHYFIEFSTLKNAGNNSMIGYLMMNTRNGEFYIKETKEQSLIDSSGANSQAEKAFVEKKYVSRNPLFYNIDGNKVWITSLHDGDGLFQQFYVVSATDPNIKASGSTMELAKDNFLKAVKNGTALNIDENQLEEETITITVTNKEYENNGEYHYLYLEDENGKMYVYTSEKAETVIMVKVGEKMKFNYKNLGENEFNTITSIEGIIK